MNAYEVLALCLAIWNLITFVVMGIDKRRAIKEKQRISESTLLLLAFAMGGLGVLIGMPVFHHKTKKLLFVIGAPLIFLVNILALLGILKLLGAF